MHSLCFQCDLKQADKINELLKLNHIQHENMKFMIQEILDHCDMSKTNPEIMKEIWDKITLHISNEDPYKNIKKLYNNLLLEMEDQLKDIIQDHLNIALKMSIIANIIDFSAKDNIDINTLMNSFINARELHLACDDSNQLLKILKTAKTLYYLGDNCGEIVLDKQFIQLIKKHYPQIEITYVVKENQL